MTLAAPPMAFLFDLDNTLLDNDRVKQDLTEACELLLGPAGSRRFWELYEDVRTMRGYVDFPHTLLRLTQELPHAAGLPRLADAVLSYPYGEAAFPDAHAVLRHARSVGPVAILSDGDPVYQPAKVARAGFADDVDGPVLVFAHKEENLDEVQLRFPAQHYVLVDDRLSILEAVKGRLGERVTTVHVRQGLHARAEADEGAAPADRVADAIGDLLGWDLAQL